MIYILLLLCVVAFILTYYYARVIKIFLEIINRLIIIFSKLEHYIKKLTISSNNFQFEDLTPVISDEAQTKNHKVYIDSLEWAVKNDSIKNVALSGYYGTGKSTIISSFTQKFRLYKYLNISLAKFRDDNSTISDEEIENSILQQIFYFEKAKNLSDSHLKRIKNNKYLVYKSVATLAWIFTAIYIFDKSNLNFLFNTVPGLRRNLISYCKEHLFLWVNLGIAIKYFLLIYFLFGLFLLIRQLYNSLLNLRIGKLSLSDAELIPKDNPDNSSLNRNLDEILYFFEKSKINIVFIEDLDRFNKPELFVKLREINTLINNCKDINYGTVKFVYAIKDEIFKENDRTKFFDFIIPVIPIINYKNSKDFFIDKLKKDYLDKNLITYDYIMDISSFINDMRMLKNIINEFKIYEKIKNNESANDKSPESLTKLFSLIIYKNIYPDDFTLLQHGMGVLYNIIHSRGELNDSLIVQKQNEIDSKQERIGELQDEIIASAKELKAIYLFALLEKIPTAKYFIAPNLSLADLIQEANFNLLTQSTSIEYSSETSWHSYKKNSHLSFKEIEKSVNPDFSFVERLAIINENNISKQTLLNSEIEKLDQQMLTLRNTGLQELINNNLKELSQFIESKIKKSVEQELKKEKKAAASTFQQSETELEIEVQDRKIKYNLLKMLIENNYIDENYLEYISYFHEGSLSFNDNLIKMRILENKEPLFEMNIDHVEHLVDELAEHNFKKESILNYQILDSLLNDAKGANPKLLHFIYSISNTRSASANFIKGFINHCETKSDNNMTLGNFISIISDQYEKLWDLVRLEKFTEEERTKILSYLLRYVGLPELRTLNYNGRFEQYLSRNFKTVASLSFDVYESQELEKLFKIFKTAFTEISYSADYGEIFSSIYENNLYEINSNNIAVIIGKKSSSGMKDQILLNNKNFTIILKSEDSKLISYIENNIKTYVEKVFLKLESNNDEDEESIVKLINNDALNDDLILAILSRQKRFLSDIGNIINQKWDIVFKSLKIIPTWYNVLLYYEYVGNINEELVSYLGEGYNFKKLSDSTLFEITEENKELVEKFFLELINSAVNNEGFKNLVTKNPYKYDDISELDFQKSRLLVLISNNSIVLSKKNFEFLTSTNYEEEFVELIFNNEDDFIDKIEEYDLDSNSILSIFNSYKLDDTKKAIVASGLLDNIEIRRGIERFITGFIIDSGISNFSYALFEKLLADESRSEIKIRLFNQYFGNLESDQIVASIRVLGDPYTNILDQLKFEIENTDYNYRFLQLLKPNYFKSFNKVFKEANLRVDY